VKGLLSEKNTTKSVTNEGKLSGVTGKKPVRGSYKKKRGS